MKNIVVTFSLFCILFGVGCTKDMRQIMSLMKAIPSTPYFLWKKIRI